MVTFETFETAGFFPAIVGMRHPFKSYNKSDTIYDEEGLLIGKQDYLLAKKLIESGGPEHAKFLRQVMVWVNITAPRFWWIEFDTYKINTTANSQSTMHTLIRDGIKEEDLYFYFGEDELANEAMRNYIQTINDLIEVYKQCNNIEIKKQYFEKIKAMLPEGFFQTRMVSLNYQVLRNMYKQRKTHRLIGWNTDFVNWVHTLPMSEWITEEFPSDDELAMFWNTSEQILEFDNN